MLGANIWVVQAVTISLSRSSLSSLPRQHGPLTAVYNHRLRRNLPSYCSKLMFSFYYTLSFEGGCQCINKLPMYCPTLLKYKELVSQCQYKQDLYVYNINTPTNTKILYSSIYSRYSLQGFTSVDIGRKAKSYNSLCSFSLCFSLNPNICFLLSFCFILNMVSKLQ